MVGAPLHRGLFRSTPLRLAIGLVVLFTLVNGVTLGVAYVSLRASALAAIRSDLQTEMAGFDVTATPGVLRTLVRARARASDPADSVYLFIGDDGRRAGNARAVSRDGQIVLRAAQQAEPLSGAGYLKEVRRLSSGLLVVAQSLEPVAALGRTFLALLAFSLLPTALVSLMLGTLVARRSARRVARIERTLDRLGEGQLSARYDPGERSGDDLTRIGAGVNRMAARQEAATDALRQVSADIAHDLRTPLQRISVLLEDLSAEVPDETRAADLAERARAEASRATDVFRALLQIAQIEGGERQAAFAAFDLGALAAEMAELYEPAAEEAGIALEIETPGAPVVATGERALVGQALANLIENALRHAGAGTALSVRVLTPATLEVCDTGPGIPEAERENVLRRLYRLERSRTTPGNGLGLSLVAAVAALHGAELRLADNAPGLCVRLAFASGESRNAGAAKAA